MSNIVKLRYVFMWDCPICGLSNEVKTAKHQLDDDTIRKFNGLDDWEEIPEETLGEAVEIPLTVKCRGDICKCEFETELPGA